MTFVEVYKPHKEYGAVSAGKFPVEHVREEPQGLRVYDNPGGWEPVGGGSTNIRKVPKRPLFFFPWASVVRLEYSEGEA